MLNIISRHIWLIDLIANRQGITFPEINEEWQRSSVNPTGDSLPVRTFCNWKKDILDEFGIKLLCNRRTNGYSIDRIDDIKDGSIREWMLNAFTVSNLLSERDALEGRILLENVPSGQVCLKHFVAAMKGNRRVRFQYSKFVSGDTQEVILEPYCVKLYERRWYVVGRNVEKDSLRTYALDRMSGVEMLDDSYKVPKSFNAEEYYADTFGVIHDDSIKPELIRLRVKKAQRDYFRTLPLHPSQKEVLTEDEYSEFTVFLRPTFDFIQQVLAQREFTQVLEPLELREKIKYILNDMLKLYT